MNLLSIHVYAIFFVATIVAGVDIKINAPSQVKQGEEFTVSFAINKGSITGIGYMMQTLPAGFGNATVVGAKNGSEFKYVPEGNVVKFIWSSLPADHEFTLSYKVKVNADAPTGNVTLAGKFFYVLNNQKQTFIIPDVSIIVSGATLTTTTTTQDYESYKKHIEDSVQRVKAEQEKARAEQERMKAEQEKAIAEQEKLKVQQDKIKASAASLVQKNENTTKENNIFRDFKDENNQSPQPGFYVVVGSFLNRDLAKAEVKRLINKGYRAASWIYFEPTKFHYVFIRRTNTKEDALKLITNAKAAGYEDVWIQRIIE